jgi:hypothetical protein
MSRASPCILRLPMIYPSTNHSSLGVAAVSLALAFAAGCHGPSSASSTAPAAPATAASARAPATGDEAAAQSAAEAWLGLVDAGSYSESWTNAASLFKGLVDQAQWEKQLNGVRTPLGKVLSRTLKAVRYATKMPGAPDGQYVVVQYDASFANKQGAVETITPMKDPDGQWRVAGYFIK